MRRTLFSEDLFYLINFLPSPPTLIGDFNCIIRQEDSEIGNSQDVRETQRRISLPLKNLVLSFGYEDGFLVQDPNRVGFTWHREGRKSSRLDRIYLPEARV